MVVKIKKQKPLMPSLREKKRYIAFEVISENQDFGEISKTIKNSALRLMGEIGYGKSSIKVMKDRWKSPRGVICCEHRYVDNIKASLAMIDKIKNSKAIIRTLTVSGLLNKTEKYLR